MTRRDLFKRLTGGLAAAGVAAPLDARVQDIPDGPSDSIVVLRFDRLLSQEERLHITEMWSRVTSKSPRWKVLPVLVLERGADFALHHIDTLKRADLIAREARAGVELGSRYCPEHGWHMFGPACEAGR